jgi:hypothetical protein
MFAYVVVIFATIHVGFHLYLWGWFSIIGFLFPTSGVDFSLHLARILLQNWLGTEEASVSCRLAYTLNFNNSPFIMSDFENYETTFNHFLLHFLRYLCNFYPNTCSEEAKLMKWLHWWNGCIDEMVAFRCGYLSMSCHSLAGAHGKDVACQKSSWWLLIPRRHFLQYRMKLKVVDHCSWIVSVDGGLLH